MKIIRFRQNGPSRVIKTGLTLEEAQAHCQREDTHGEGWFDGYEDEDADRDFAAEAEQEARLREGIAAVNRLTSDDSDDRTVEVERVHPAHGGSVWTAEGRDTTTGELVLFGGDARALADIAQAIEQDDTTPVASVPAWAVLSVSA